LTTYAPVDNLSSNLSNQVEAKNCSFTHKKEADVKVLRKEQNIGIELKCYGGIKRCGRVPGRGCWG
jgi:hypothetical protein